VPKLRTHVLFAVFMLCVLGATSAFAQDGFAKVNGLTGAVFSSGGASTTNITAVRTGTGEYDVTFTGSFLGITADQVIINTTAQRFGFGVTNALVVGISDTTIVIHVSVWDSSTQVSQDNNFFITINIGS
jgi:hypothetical protein